MYEETGVGNMTIESHWDNVRHAYNRVSAEVETLSKCIGRTEDGWLELRGESADRQKLISEWRHLQRAKMELILCCRTCEEMQL